MMPFTPSSPFISPATMSEIDLSQIPPPPWPWPRSLTDKEALILTACLVEGGKMLSAYALDDVIHWAYQLPPTGAHIEVSTGTAQFQ